MMTRKHYQIIANGFNAELKRLWQEDENGLDRSHHITGVILAAKSVADELQEDNPRFDHTRFIEACVEGT